MPKATIRLCQKEMVASKCLDALHFLPKDGRYFEAQQAFPEKPLLSFHRRKSPQIFGEDGTTSPRIQNAFSNTKAKMREHRTPTPGKGILCLPLPPSSETAAKYLREVEVLQCAEHFCCAGAPDRKHSGQLTTDGTLQGLLDDI